MTNEDFRARQALLGMSGTELADALASNEGSVSRWRRSTPIPDYIAALLDQLCARALPNLELPLTLADITALDRLARARGLTIPRLIASLLHEHLHPPLYTLPEPEPAAKVAEP